MVIQEILKDLKISNNILDHQGLVELLLPHTAHFLHLGMLTIEKALIATC